MWFRSATGLYFSFLAMPLFGFDIRVIPTSESELGRFFAFNFLEEIVGNQYHFHLKHLGRLANETRWAWRCLLWKVINHRFHFVNSYKPLHSVWVFFWRFGSLCHSRSQSVSYVIRGTLFVVYLYDSSDVRGGGSDDPCFFYFRNLHLFALQWITWLEFYPFHWAFQPSSFCFH